MGARARMTMRARVEQLRGSPGETPVPTDDWGDPGIPAGPSTLWETKTDAVPCWFWVTQEREMTGPDATAVVEDFWMIVPKRADIVEQNRINGVTDRRGVVLYAGALLIESVVSHREHQQLHLIGIRSGG
jgi:hypothetical protein